MYHSSLSKKKLVSKNETSYPITLSDMRDNSYLIQSIDISSDNSLDNEITNLLIPSVVENWEEETKYLLLEQTWLGFASFCKLESFMLPHLNLQNIEYIKYYPFNWDEQGAKTELEQDKYTLLSESLGVASSVVIKQTWNYVYLFKIDDNIEVKYNAGFTSNVFTNLPKDIRQCLMMSVAQKIDAKFGVCNEIYTGKMIETFNKYRLKESIINIV